LALPEKLAMPWQSKRQKKVVDLPEDAHAAAVEAYLKLGWDEKWTRSADLPVPDVELLVQYLWHFDMINDVPRNQAYHGAIIQAVEAVRLHKSTNKNKHGLSAAEQTGMQEHAAQVPEDGSTKGSSSVRVLDVGTGSGLLALLAAKSGATHVTAIEMEAAVARIASMNVVRNQLHDTVKVEVGESTSSGFATARVPGRVDIVVAELLDTGLLGESFIPVLRDARARGWMVDAGGDDSAQQGARVVPCRARVFGQLVESTVRLGLSLSSLIYWISH
jgi:type II protein arginine methyltransferase